jgi:transposase-like protein
MNIAGKLNNFGKRLRGKITALLSKMRPHNFAFHITDTQRNAKISDSRDTEASEIRDIERPSADIETALLGRSQGVAGSKGHAPNGGQLRQRDGHCPYCQSKDFVKRGLRQKKKERIQLYLCRSCRRTFTQFPVKGKSYSLPVIIDALSYYNLGFSFGQVSQVLKEKQGVEIQSSSVFDWYEQYKPMCAYARMRPYALKEFTPYNVIESATLAHRQLYRYCFHRAKAKLIINETFRHYHLKPIIEFLEMVPGECPHQYFQDGLRASEAPLFFPKRK